MFHGPATTIRRLCDNADQQEEEIVERINEAFTIVHASQLTRSSIPKTRAAWRVAANDCFGNLPLELAG